MSESIFLSTEAPFALKLLQSAPGSSIEGQSFAEMLKEFPAEAGDRDVLFLVWEMGDDVHILCKSRTNEVRAYDMLKALKIETGLVHGDAHSATEKATLAGIQIQMEEAGKNSLEKFLFHVIDTYFKNCEVIRPAEYAAKHQARLLALPKYVKKHIAWAYVRSTDAAPAGSRIIMRTFENESGIEIVTGEDIYIMIGCQGEIYHIEREKFERTYEVTDEPFDLFAQMTLYIPEICILPGEEYESLDDRAFICYPRPGIPVYAKQLTRTTKIFPKYAPDEYFLGQEGDYMLVRSDDLSDIYIVRRNVFLQTYEPVTQTSQDGVC